MLGVVIQCNTITPSTTPTRIILGMLPANPANEAVRVKRRQRLFPTNNNPLPNSNHPHHRRRCGRHNNNTDDTSTSATASGTVDTSKDGTSDKEEGGHTSDDEDEEHTIYTMTNANDWKQTGGRTQGCDIDPILFTGDNKIFTVKVTEEELEQKKD